MIHKIIKEEIRVPGTLEDTYLETYLLSVTDKFTVQERPLILGLSHGCPAIFLCSGCVSYSAFGTDKGGSFLQRARGRVLH